MTLQRNTDACPTKDEVEAKKGFVESRAPYFDGVVSGPSNPNQPEADAAPSPVVGATSRPSAGTKLGLRRVALRDMPALAERAEVAKQAMSVLQSLEAYAETPKGARLRAKARERRATVRLAKPRKRGDDREASVIDIG